MQSLTNHSTETRTFSHGAALGRNFTLRGGTISNHHSHPAPVSPSIDRPVFAVALLCLLGVSVPILVAPEPADAVVSAIYQWMARELGLIYQWATLFTLGFLGWLAFSRHGARVLGRTPEPEYDNASWMAMLFCAGIGGGLLYWSTIEWAFYVDQPPFGVEPGSVAAREWAATYGIFHWGPSAWGLYALPTVAIAYPYYRYDLPYLRLSGALVGLFGRGFPDRPLGRAVDFFFIIALIGGTGTSLGLATPMLGAVAARLFDVDQSLGLTWIITGACVALFGTSVYLGLDRGIKRLSNVNLVLAGIFLAWVLAAGPARFALELGTSSVGLMLQEFIRMNTWTEPLADTGFVEDWTIFYWAWWIAYGPFMGLFVTRISRGRSLRALILGMAGFGTLGCAAFYVVWGNSVLWLDLHGGLGLLDLVRAGDAATAIAAAIGGLAGQPGPLLLFLVLGFVFVATTYDSASYAIAAAATRDLRAGTHPHRAHRLFWAAGLACLPVALVVVDSLRAVQSAVLVVSLPILVIGVLAVVSLMRSLHESEDSA